MPGKIARRRRLAYLEAVNAPAGRPSRILSRAVMAVGVVALLGLAPAGDASAKRRGAKTHAFERVRWPASLSSPSLAAWVRSFIWEFVHLKGWSSIFTSTSEAGSALGLGQSVGKPYRGTLVGAVALPEHHAYHRRHPKRIYGTTSTVRHLQTAIETVHETFPNLHRLAVGDLSAREGGKLGGHRSHQSGRDVDLGFYFRQRPWIYPFKFAQPTARNLHFRATWALIKALADTSDEPDGVDYILLDYDVQRLLYIWAMQQDDLRDDVERILQYPRGRMREVGIVRHFPKHANHLHVRFKCPPQDMLCI
jgi:murein endopeptidase